MGIKSLSKKIRTGIIVGIIFGGCLAGCASTSDQFEVYVKNGEYVKAIDLYVSEIRGNSALEMNADAFLSSYLDEQWNGYLDGSVENSSMEITFDVYQNLYNTIPVEGLEQLLQDFQTTKQARSTYEEGIACLEQEDFVGAIESFEQIPETPDSTYDEAQDELEKAKSSYSEEILSRAKENVADSDFDGAISLVEEAEKVVGELDELESFLNDTYTEKYETAIAEAMSDSKYEDLFTLYEQATSNPRVTVSATMTANYTSGTEAYADKVLDDASAIKESEGLPAALETLEDGLSVLPEQSALLDEYEIYANEFRNTVLTDADLSLQTSGYEAAYSIIQQSLDVLPDDQILLDKGEYYQSLKPVRLSSLESYTSDGQFRFADSREDNFGNSHNDVIYTLEGFSSGPNSTATETYRVNEKYQTISGVVFLSDDGKNTSYNGAIRIYGDGELLYAAEITKGFEPENFTVDISTVVDLSVEIRDPDFYGASGHRCLSDVLLYPNY